MVGSLLPRGTLVLPLVNDVPLGISAAVPSDVRIAWSGMQAVLWAGLRLGFGVLAERVLKAPYAARPTTLPVRI